MLMEVTSANNPAAMNPGTLIFRGVISIVFGLIALAWPGPSLLAVALLFGVYAFVDGIFAMAAGARQGRRHQSWGVPVFEGILGLVAGIVTFFWPGVTLFALSLLVGIWALTTGVLEIVGAFRIHEFMPNASTAARVLLGLAGAFSAVLGIVIFAIPALGAIALISLVAAYALVFGVVMIGLGGRLRRDQTALLRVPEERPSRAA
jgi:uncharacterized membrane protein HdeD (DUF308 family)